MKLCSPTTKPRVGERGFYLVVVLLIMAAIMLIYLGVNTGRLGTLKRELRLVEQKQIERLNRSAALTTNTAPILAPAAAP